jgi:hypothetical protein
MPVLLMFQINPNAQTYSQLPDIQTPSPQMAKNFQGVYVNSEFGVEISLPEGTPGTEMESQTKGVTELTIPAPPIGAGGIKVFLSNSTEASHLTSSTLQELQTDPPDCKLGSNSVTIGGKIAKTSNDPCNVMGITPSKIKLYYIDLGSGKTLDISFIAPTSLYDMGLPAFEELVKRVKFTK